MPNSACKKTPSVEHSGYQQLFDLRGSAYDLAMRYWPGARAEEFCMALAPLTTHSPLHIADVPAGGRYLQNFLPAGCHYHGHEPCSSFTNHGAANSRPLLPLPWEENSMDAAVSLAGLHHLNEKLPLFTDLHRIVRAGGKLVVADVAKDSAAAHFLDQYVGRHNSTGHSGIYLDARTLGELERSQWQIDASETIDLHWIFSGKIQMAHFCHLLFDLRRCSVHETLAAIESRLGIDVLGERAVGMRWSLMRICASKKSG